MGNSNTKESRHDARAFRPTGSSELGQSSSQPQGHDGRSRSHGRVGRPDIGGLLGLQPGSSSSSERRETRQEREARRLERERQARLVERERSMREEHVDGGYLVTLGTYVGAEDFNKTVVRQLQIDRKMAPFWRGLQDFSDTWTEYQIVAAARGLDIPPPDQPPPEGFLPQHPSLSSAGDQHLTVPGSAAAPGPSAANTAACIPTGSLAGTSSPSLSLPTTSGSSRTGSSPFRPRAKAIAAALSVSSRNGSSTDLTPREITLPHDPFVNGQPIEVFLYKNATECPICFITYPPYLNHTRCCDQPLCSECFVQIKRAEPHYPEGHGDNHENQEANPEEQAGLLISEPASCPYCQQPEFGVTYEPPPFRRGLSYGSGAAIGAMATAMSSTSTVNSLMPSSLAVAGSTSPPTGRRRTQSLSATAPNVVTTDRIRPDWSTKLASQRAHIARRAAAATALHTAAFLIGSEQRTFRVGRFGRWAGSSSNQRDREASPARGQSDGGEGGDGPSPTMEPGPRSSSGPVAGVAGGAGGAGGAGALGAAGATGAAGAAGRRSRMDDLEELMFREALRQSLATEDERRRKEEKEQRKEAKRREKDERKAAKAASKQHGSGSGVYGASGGSGHSSASASSLSLSGLGIGGRRRGNSGASNLRVEASVANAMAARSSGSGSGSGSGSSSPATPGEGAGDKGKKVDRGPTAGVAVSVAVASESESRPTSSAQRSAGPSHLRQMSSASSVSSSSPGNSAAGQAVQDPRASGLSLGSRSGGSEDGADHGDERDPSTSMEPMFNFSSLAELVGVQLEGENAGRRLSAIERDKDGSTGSAGSQKEEVREAHGEHVELAERRSFERLQLATGLDKTSRSVPEVMITPGTPAPSDEFD